MKLILVAILIPAVAFCQKKGDNEIIVKGVSFSEVVKRIFDSGQMTRKMDSNYNTVSTEFEHYNLSRGKFINNGYMSICVKVEDSTAFITGIWYGDPHYMNFEPIKLTKGFVGLFFSTMNYFALSFQKPVKYIRRYPLLF